MRGTRATVQWSKPDAVRPNRQPAAIPPGYMHVGVVGQIAAILDDLGYDSASVVRSAGLQPRQFQEPGSVVPVANVGLILHRCQVALGRTDIAVRVASSVGLSSLALVGEYIRCCDTVGEALRALEAHFQVLNRGAVLQILVHQDVVVLEFAPYLPDMAGTDLFAEGGLGAVVQVLRELCGPDWAPIEVLLPRRPPADQSAYRAMFRAPIRFNQETAALIVPRALMDRRLASPDPERRRSILAQITDIERAGPEDLLDELRRLLRRRLIGANFTATDAARALGIHRRTLSRQLHAAGLTFRQIVDDTRFGIARQLVGGTDIPLAQVAALLNFSEPAAFTRAFERWAGVPPSRWRDEQRLS